MIIMPQAWDKQKNWVPNRNRTHDLPNIGGGGGGGGGLYPLSYENSWWARPFTRFIYVFENELDWHLYHIWAKEIESAKHLKQPRS